MPKTTTNQQMSVNSTTFIAVSFIISLALIGFNISAGVNYSLRNTVSSPGFDTVSPRRIQELENEVRKLKKLVRGSQISVSDVYGVVIPNGPAIARPSARTTKEEESSINRKFYGGRGDKPHLGGFTAFDPNGISPSLWKEMVEWIGVKSLVDVGCGRGISTSWFVLHGMEYVVCVEGSHDAVEHSLLPGLKPQEGTEFELVEHDFSLGPWW
jgi:hypothetical protein